jgi:hypothetical protein
MAALPTVLVEWTSDKILFPLAQALLIAFVVLAIAISWWHALRAGRGRVSLEVTRCRESMALFYGAYVAITGLFVALSLSVEIAAEHRVFWAVLDTALIAYVCLLNRWFRNKLVGWFVELTKLERR